MFHRLSSTTLVWMTFLMAVTSLVAVFASFPDDDPSTMSFPSMSQLLESRPPSKRMSQMSCRCCSNSFNSHCCLKCMHRLGKRQDDQLFGSNSPFDSVLPAIEDMVPDGFSDTYRSDMTMLGRACLCCLDQMKTLNNPFVEFSSCCHQCKHIGI